MRKFIWKATDAAGREVVERIHASDAATARSELARRGLTNLRLQQDEFATTAEAGVRQESNSEYDPALSAEEEAKFFDGKIPGFWQQWWSLVKQHPLWELTWLILLGWSLYQGAYVWAATAAVPLLLFPALQFWFGMPGRIYDRLNRAKVWSRWPDVLTLANRLERVQKLVRIGVPKWEIARCRAQALAGLGRLSEGIDGFERFESDPTLDRAMYQCHLASIYDVAKDFEKSLNLRMAAAQAMPKNMSVWIDLSMHYAHRMQELNPARAAYARIEESLVPELGRPYLDLLQGMMFSLERNFSAAKSKLEAAIAGFRAYQHNPLVRSVVLLSSSYLCWCCASLVETAEARKLWKEVRPFLEAGREEELIRRIKLSLGETT